MLRRPFTLLIHIALVTIVAGAIVTHYCGIQGELALAEGNRARTFEKSSGPGEGAFPFSVALDSVEIEYYPGTTTPMDFRSYLVIDSEPVAVSMNRVAEVNGWRFYQSGISAGATRLSVSYDPWGIGITYCGYALALVGMVGFFFQRKTLWRALLSKGKRMAVAVALLAPLTASAAQDIQLPAMQRPLAANLGKAYVYWNDRICPLQTMAKDVALKLYGATTYRGMTSEQILSGWLFYFDTWERDYLASHCDTPAGVKALKSHNERLALINWLGTGEAFRVYPYRTAAGHTEWLSLTGRRPSKMSLEQWKFMQTTMPRIKQLLLQGRNIEANEVVAQLIAGQVQYAGAENLPSAAKMQAERIYNRFASLLPAAIIALLLGAGYLYGAVRKVEVKRSVRRCAWALTAAVACYILWMVAMMWCIGGHLPLSNGPEMMTFMGLIATVLSLTSRNRLLRGSFLIVAAMTLMVGVMGGRTPRIGMLMPVLISPLLSVHVMLVMTAYVFFLLTAILSVIGLITKQVQAEATLYRINCAMLVPAVFLLGGGIIVGAVWANMSWGRYWGWDPKETCALVMLLIYSVPLHRGHCRLKAFRQPKVLHWYLLAAVLSVAFTYFGANYLLPGLHSYA